MDQPIACSLSSAEMPKRLAEMRSIGVAALESAAAAGGSAELRFRAGPETRERLEAVVAAEEVCCAFLDFELAERGGTLVLTIRSPEGGEPVMHELVDAFSQKT